MLRHVSLIYMMWSDKQMRLRPLTTAKYAYCAVPVYAKDTVGSSDVQTHIAAVPYTRRPITFIVLLLVLLYIAR